MFVYPSQLVLAKHYTDPFLLRVLVLCPMRQEWDIREETGWHVAVYCFKVVRIACVSMVVFYVPEPACLFAEPVRHYACAYCAEKDIIALDCAKCFAQPLKWGVCKYTHFFAAAPIFGVVVHVEVVGPIFFGPERIYYPRIANQVLQVFKFPEYRCLAVAWAYYDLVCRAGLVSA